VVFVLLGCGGEADDDSVRGRGLRSASLAVASQAAVYESAVRAAFDITPDLVLLLEPRYLPREGGQVAGDSMPEELVAALRRRGLVRGTCAPPHDGSRSVPVCNARASGYVIRFTEPYRAGGDTIQVHFSALRYRTRDNEPAEALSFERAYQLTGSGQRWRVVREARVPQD
jgi:hypothetical protein